MIRWHEPGSRFGQVASLRAVSATVAVGLCGACLNTQSVAFEQAPAAASSPAVACRDVAEASGWKVIEVHGLEEVDEGYWEARVEVDDRVMRDLVVCRHNTNEGWTEIVSQDE